MQSPSSASSKPICVLVADSNQTQSQLLVSALRRRGEFDVISCSMEYDAILGSIESASVEVVILNPARAHNGTQDMSSVRRVHLAHSEVRKIVLLESYDREVVVNAFRSGARGLFCFSEHPFRLLCKCIHCVHRGQIWLSGEQLEYLIEVVTHVPSLRAVNSKGMKLLTAREEQVVALVADGLSNREIADELNLSEHTVKKYLFRIFDKLGISSRVELVLYAVSHGDNRPAEWVAGAPS